MAMNQFDFFVWNSSSDDARGAHDLERLLFGPERCAAEEETCH